MTLDRCLPQFLLKQNRRRTTHRIIIAFFLLTVSVLLITKGELGALAGVYTISFLSVMALFGIGNLLLKVKREGLPRPVRSSWLGTLVAIAAVLAGLVGNAIMNPQYLRVFLEYLVPTVLLVSVVLWRISLLQLLLFVVRRVTARIANRLGRVAQAIRSKIDELNSQQIVFFSRGDNVANLNRAMLYVRLNEPTKRVKVVLVVQDDDEIPPNLKTDIDFLNEVYPEIDIEFVVIHGVFSPELIRDLSRKWRIPINLMFIGSPGTHFMYGLAELGGVRLII